MRRRSEKVMEGRDAGRCGEMQGDAGRCGEMAYLGEEHAASGGHVGREGEVETTWVHPEDLPLELLR